VSDRHLHPVEGGPPDAVARWNRLKTEYPEAAYTFSDGWFYGALRDDDDVLRASELDWLINRLMAREQGNDDSR
jgi:hypothetical protein